MRLGNVGEIAEQVFDGKLECNARVRITLADHGLEILVLLDELVLHAVPDHLQHASFSNESAQHIGST